MQVKLRTEEEWKVIPEHPDYFISNWGRVWSDHNNMILKNHLERNGYLSIRLSDNKKCTKRIHRLVAEVFIPNPNNLPEVNHKNHIRTDNHITNLEWCTGLQNNKDRNKPTHSKYSFVTKCKNSWVAQITINKKKVLCEYFPTEIEAVKRSNEFIIQNNLNYPLNII